ncbi:MAG: restriction alleviation protein, Lar family [bacterium]|nr:restriction alleviation protein, Lar family [bacterium]
MNDQDTPKLKPCPFCGEPPERPDFGDDDTVWHQYAVECLNCDADGPREPSVDAAIAAWNKRHE